MPVRTRVLVKQQLAATTGADVVFTCPPDRTAIVKDARISVGAPAGTARLAVLRSGVVGAVELVAVTSAGVAAHGRADPPPWVVLEEGDTLYVVGTAGMVVNVWASGTLLDGDPA